MKDDLADEEEWGVYETSCRSCGIAINVVATVHSVENGYAEAFKDGQPQCLVCENKHLAGVN